MMNNSMKLNTPHSPIVLTGWRALLLTALLFIGSQAFAAQSITFYHNDILGSPVATTDENGNICWREDYQPYGDKLKNNDAYEPSTAGCGLDDNQRGYTGHVFDKDIGLTYMQARYYDPVVGRFMGVDPVGVRLDNQVSFNRYAYGNNNPYKYTDPDGEIAVLARVGQVALAFSGAYLGYKTVESINPEASTSVKIAGAFIGGYLVTKNPFGFNTLIKNPYLRAVALVGAGEAALNLTAGNYNFENEKVASILNNLSFDIPIELAKQLVKKKVPIADFLESKLDITTGVLSEVAKNEYEGPFAATEQGSN